MKSRVLAWCVVIGIAYVAYAGAKSWRNPFSMPLPAPAITSVLPPQPDGCMKNPGCL